MQGAQVPFVVRKLRSHVLWGVAKKIFLIEKKKNVGEEALGRKSWVYHTGQWPSLTHLGPLVGYF